MTVVRFHFDYVSPNAYLAWTQLPRIAAAHGAVVEPVPVLFAGLLEAYGQLGPAEVPPKIRWMTRNNLRKAALLGVALNPPAYHPFNPLLALRASSLPLAPAARSALVGALFEAVWVRGWHLAEASVVARCAREVGLDGDALVAQAASDTTKGELRRQTEDALASGVFGVPAMQIGDELFWGFDDLPFVERCLAGSDPVDCGAWQRWLEASPQPSAQRTRRS